MASQAQAAAISPSNERTAGAQANQVGVMQAAPTGRVEQSSFLETLRNAIRQAMPQQMEGAREYMNGDDRSRLGQAVSSNVSQQASQAAGPVQSATTAPPDTSSVPARQSTPMPPAPQAQIPPQVGARDAMPERRPPEEVSLETGRQQTEQLFTENNLTDTQLQRANDPRFSAASHARQEANRYAQTGPQQFRAREGQVLDRAQSQAAGDEARGMTGMQQNRTQSAQRVRSGQDAARARDEARRREVAANIERIYQRTRTRVETRLTDMESTATRTFDQGAQRAIDRMKSYVNTRFDARYSGIDGAGRWIRDKFLPLPADVRAWFDQAHEQFRADLDALVVLVANLVESRLREAKQEIDNGQREIQNYVESLPRDLRSVGQAAASEISSRFDELRRSVDERRENLVQSLAQRYREASERGDRALQEMRDAHKSLYERVRDGVAEVIRVLRDFRDRVLSLIRQARDTIELIVSDPIQFLRNLLAAIRQGISQFVINIWTHLRNGFIQWLMGPLGEAGIDIPRDLSLPSIFHLVLQVLGLTYDRIRARAARIIGERNVAILEAAFELLRTLWTGGPAALWERVREHLSNLRQMVIDEIQNWLITTIIRAAVTRLVSMFNPVGAIIQAILTIYNVVMFLIERIRQIMAFVEAVISSVSNIARGAIGQAANWIEQALGRTVPIIIAFLARLLSISGIAERITSIIRRIQARVEQAVDRVIIWVRDRVRGLVGAGRRAVASVREWWKEKKPFTTKSGEKHEISFSGDEKKAIPMVASKKSKPVDEKLNEFYEKANGAEASVDEKNGKALIEKTRKDATKEPNDPNLVVNMRKLFEFYEEGDSGGETRPVWRIGTLGGSTVGIEMTADVLGPKNIGGGTPPKDNVQDELMSRLVVEPVRGRSTTEKYIRGHLLNENLGGKGEAENLFPITGYANKQHLLSTETKVKDWVINKKKFAYYKVEVKGISSRLDAAHKSHNYVNSSFVCHFILKEKARDKKGKEERINIPSIFLIRTAAEERTGD